MLSTSSGAKAVATKLIRLNCPKPPEFKVLQTRTSRSSCKDAKRLGWKMACIASAGVIACIVLLGLLVQIPALTAPKRAETFNILPKATLAEVLPVEMELRDAAAVKVERAFQTDVDPLNLKPMYHIAPPQGWLNDPNGMFELNGRVHVFYQFNPKAPVWGSPYWAHVVSTDMVHWSLLEDALVPDKEYDKDGCFSGSVTISDSGVPVILYTGVSKLQELGYHYQVQAAARPANMKDPNLVQWVKFPENPVSILLPAGGSHRQFRDPTTAWKGVTSIGGPSVWLTAVGVQVEGVGGAALYESPDLLNWTYAGSLFSQLGLASARSDVIKCQNAMKAKGEHTAGQFDAVCHMWECPDFFQLDQDIWVVKYSDQVQGRVPFGLDWYVLSDQPPNYQRALSEGDNAFHATYLGAPYVERVIDYGTVYASKAFRHSDGRMIWIGWIYEDSAGSVEMNGNGSNFTELQGWQGVLTLSREVTFDPATKSLVFYPVKEVDMLQGAALFILDSELLLQERQEEVLVPEEPAPSDPSRHQRRILANFDLALPKVVADRSSIPFSVGIILRTGGGTMTTVSIDGTAKIDGKNQVIVTAAFLTVDRSASGGATKSNSQGGPIDLPDAGLPARDLALDVFVDSSVIEAYANHGHGRVTSRIYPIDSQDTNWGVSVFGEFDNSHATMTSAEVHEMNPCWVDQRL